jgi:glycosyltransferase involved in cell wall biosynthesis
MPTQTHTFAWSLARSLNRAGAEITLLSATPASTFPINRRLVFMGASFKTEGLAGRMLGFVNLLVLKHLTRSMACLIGGIRALRQWRTEVLVVHGVHSPFLWFAVLARLVCVAKVVAVLTDPPGVVLPTDGRISSALKQLDVYIVKLALRRYDGVIALTKELGTDFAPNVPAFVMEGFFEEPPQASSSKRPKSKVLTIAYAGGLTRAYGVDRLVYAVKGLDRRDIRLALFGRGELEEWISAQAEEDARIERARFMDRASLGDELRSAHVLVNPRPTTEEFVKYSFPSKIMDYLATRVPIVTTRLPGIPAEYGRFLVFSDSDSPDSLRAAIQRVMEMDVAEVDRLSESAFEFAKSSRSIDGQGRRIVAFLRSVQLGQGPNVNGKASGLR